MIIVKSRGGMAAILASLALASVTAFAQAPAGGPGGGPPRGPGGGGGGGGFGGPQTKDTVIQRNGLAMPELKLTDAQKAAIDKLAEKNAADSTALQAKYPPAQGGGAPNPEQQAARTKLREDFTAEVNKVLNAEQQKVWAARPQGGRGGGGGGFGGGAGGPPGGGAGGPPPGGA